MWNGFFSTGQAALTWVNGVMRTPSVGAEFIATPAAPWPRSSRIWVIAPPAECPIRIGSESSSPITDSRCSTISDSVSSSSGVGSAFSASTSTSSPG